MASRTLLVCCAALCLLVVSAHAAAGGVGMVVSFLAVPGPTGAFLLAPPSALQRLAVPAFSTNVDYTWNTGRLARRKRSTVCPRHSLHLCWASRPLSGCLACQGHDLRASDPDAAALSRWPVQILSAVLAASICVGVGVGKSNAADAQADHTTHAIQEAGRREGHASHAPRTLLLATPAGLPGCANTALGADKLVCCSSPLNLADPTVKRAAAALAVGLILSIPFGVPASALFVAGVSVVELAKPVRVGLVLSSLPLLWLKARPRIRKLRFNLEEFAKSDFFKIFDFWRLLESALGGGGAGRASGAIPIMDPMTAEREAALPKADPVWVNLNEELWATKESAASMQATIVALELENQELRAELETQELRISQLLARVAERAPDLLEPAPPNWRGTGTQEGHRDL